MRIDQFDLETRNDDVEEGLAVVVDYGDTVVVVDDDSTVVDRAPTTVADRGNIAFDERWRNFAVPAVVVDVVEDDDGSVDREWGVRGGIVD